MRTLCREAAEFAIKQAMRRARLMGYMERQEAERAKNRSGYFSRIGQSFQLHPGDSLVTESND